VGRVFYKIINYVWLVYALLTVLVLWPSLTKFDLQFWGLQIELVIA